MSIGQGKPKKRGGKYYANVWVEGVHLRMCLRNKIVGTGPRESKGTGRKGKKWAD